MQLEDHAECSRCDLGSAQGCGRLPTYFCNFDYNYRYFLVHSPVIASQCTIDTSWQGCLSTFCRSMAECSLRHDPPCLLLAFELHLEVLVLRDLLQPLPLGEILFPFYLNRIIHEVDEDKEACQKKRSEGKRSQYDTTYEHLPVVLLYAGH